GIWWLDTKVLNGMRSQDGSPDLKPIVGSSFTVDIHVVTRVVLVNLDAFLIMIAKGKVQVGFFRSGRERQLMIVGDSLPRGCTQPIDRRDVSGVVYRNLCRPAQCPFFRGGSTHSYRPPWCILPHISLVQSVEFANRKTEPQP